MLSLILYFTMPTASAFFIHTRPFRFQTFPYAFWISRCCNASSRDGQMKGEHGLVSMPCYNVTLEEGTWAQVRWDWVQKDYDCSA